MIIHQLNVYHYHIPLIRSLPVGVQRIDLRQGMVVEMQVKLGGSDISTHIVEISPLSGKDVDGHALRGFSHESIEHVEQRMLDLAPLVVGSSVDVLLEHVEQIEEASLAYGLSLLHAKARGQLKAARIRPKLIPLIFQNKDEPLESVAARVSALPAETHAVKVKVAQTSIEQELKLIYQILAVRPKLTLRLDANRGFELEQAIDFCASLPLEQIEYIEEPCINPQDNLKLHLATGVRYGLDESLNVAHFELTPQRGLAALVIKPTILGSLSKLQYLVEEAELEGIRCVLSSSLEANIGIEDIIDLAASITPDEPPGVDTLSAFGVDLIVRSDKKKCLTLDDLTVLGSFRASATT